MNKPETIAAHADEAARILNSQLFNDIFDAIRRRYVKEWEELPTSDTETARDIHRRVKCLADVKAALGACINAGKVLQREQTLREKAQNAMKRALKPLSNATGVR